MSIEDSFSAEVTKLYHKFADRIATPLLYVKDPVASSCPELNAVQFLALS